MAACLTGTKVFGEKAVTLATEARLPVDEGGLGDKVPRGEPPTVML